VAVREREGKERARPLRLLGRKEEQASGESNWAAGREAGRRAEREKGWGIWFFFFFKTFSFIKPFKKFKRFSNFKNFKLYSKFSN
jgi:hypothetical protein